MTKRRSSLQSTPPTTPTVPKWATDRWTWRHQLYKAGLYLWDAGATPGAFLRGVGPYGPKMVNGYARNRWAPLQAKLARLIPFDTCCNLSTGWCCSRVKLQLCSTCISVSVCGSGMRLSSAWLLQHCKSPHYKRQIRMGHGKS